jgi:hypothetical protein
MLIVPLAAVPNQAVTVTLNGQVSQIDVYQTDFGLFLDLYVNDVLIIGGVIGENLNRIVRSLYLGFSGDLAWIDSQGATDPVYTGLGPTTAARYSLAYLFPSDLLPGEG